VTREGFLKDKCGPRAKTFEHRCFKQSRLNLAGKLFLTPNQIWAFRKM